MEISLCMIVKDEEDVLERCLSGIMPAIDEIIIVDTGSSDNTKEIAERCGAKVYDFEWIEDFSAARNYSFSLATKDYIMWLDADDVIDSKNLKKLIELKRGLPEDVGVVYMKYETNFDKFGNATFAYERERLFKKSANPIWVGRIHEIAECRAQNFRSDISIQHRKLKRSDPDRNIRIYENMIADGAELNLRDKFYYARELMFHARYDEAIEKYLEVIGDNQAWLENKMTSVIDLASCYRALGNHDAEIDILLKSLSFDLPRAEICCKIGDWWMKKKNYRTAVFWYETAIAQKPDTQSGAFVMLDYYGYIPYLQLCVCYDKLGDTQRAIYCNEKAGMIKPEDPSYLFNVDYFINKLSKNQTILKTK